VYKKFLLPYVVSSGCDEDGLKGIWNQPLAIDSDNNLLEDVIIIGDMEGQLHLLDMEPEDATPALDPVNWTNSVVFYATADDFDDYTGSHIYSYKGGSSRPLPFAFSPAATYSSDGSVLVYAGTGDPSTIDEFSTTSRGHLYGFVYSKSADTFELSATFNSVASVNNGGTPQPGFLTFDEGEILAGEPVIAAGTIYFTTYVRSSSGCGLGEGRLYAVDYKYGKSVLDYNLDGTVEEFQALGTGIPSGVVIGHNQVYVTMNTGGNSAPSTKRGKGNMLTMVPPMPYSWVEVTGR
jgi:hypothetical protein